MRKTIHKWFWAWDFDKEEKWINEMAAKGRVLCGIGYATYTFEEGNPGEYVYRLEMLDKVPTSAESVQYINFIEDTGAEYIGSLFRWVYFRKRAGAVGFDLFSDIDSRIKHLDRIIWFAGVLSAANLFSGINNLFLHSSIDMNITVGLLSLSVGLLLGCGFLKLFFKKSKLKKEKILHE